MALDVMARGAASILAELHRSGGCDGVLGMGGSGGSTVVAAAVQSLPVGVPKLLVSTMAAGDVSPYVGCSDLCLMYSVTDIAGINSISRKIFTNAALALAGMLREPNGKTGEVSGRPVVGLTMLGVTTPGVRRVAGRLETAGFEVVTFHAVGAGGRAMERLIADGTLAGIVDFTPSELTDELLGGIFSAGPDRCRTAAQMRIPQVVVPGALEVLNFGPQDSVPAKYRTPERRIIRHNRAVTAVRVTTDEGIAIGAELGRRLSPGGGYTIVIAPKQGLDEYEKPDGPYRDPEADSAMLGALKASLPEDIPVIEIDRHINEAEFADAVAEAFIRLYDSISTAAATRQQETHRP
jgi:uncharacterized protein (UPF0261 family)